MSQKLPANDLKWLKQGDLSQFSEDFMKTMMKTVIHDIFLK